MQCKSIVLNSYGDTLVSALDTLSVQTREIPELLPNQVLIQMEAAPCNPSDLLFLTNQYGVSKTLPTVPGWEGCGTVIKTGSFLNRWLLGKRVACGGQEDSDGTWSEYFVTTSKNCLPISTKLSTADAACFLVNPMTAYGLLSEAQNHGHKVILQTAAASQVGRIVNVLARKQKIKVINIVRREDQKKTVEQYGGQHILNQSDPDFLEQMRSYTKQFHITAAFEAISGSMTGHLINSLCKSGEVFLYGALSEQDAAEIDPISVIFSNKSLRGFYVGDWIRKQNILKLLKASQFLQNMFINKEFSTVIQRETDFQNAPAALLDYSKNMTKGKILLKKSI